MAAKTLRQIAERLNAIVAENDARGWSDRNDLPAGVEVRSHTPTGRMRKTRLFKIDYVSSAKTGVGNTNLCGVISVNGDYEVKY